MANQTTYIPRKGQDIEAAAIDASGLINAAVGVRDGNYAAVSADGAIPIPSADKTFFITKSASGAAMTLADPTAGAPGVGHDNLLLTFISTTAQAHTLSNAAGSGFFSSGGSGKDVGTFGGAIGDRISVRAYQGKWYLEDSLNVTLG